MLADRFLNIKEMHQVGNVETRLHVRLDYTRDNPDDVAVLLVSTILTVIIVIVVLIKGYPGLLALEVMLLPFFVYPLVFRLAAKGLHKIMVIDKKTGLLSVWNTRHEEVRGKAGLIVTLANIQGIDSEGDRQRSADRFIIKLRNHKHKTLFYTRHGKIIQRLEKLVKPFIART